MLEEGVGQKKTAESDDAVKPSTGKRHSAVCILIPPPLPSPPLQSLPNQPLHGV